MKWGTILLIVVVVIAWRWVEKNVATVANFEKTFGVGA